MDERANPPADEAAGPTAAPPVVVGGRGMLALLIVLVGSAALWAALKRTLLFHWHSDANYP
jgi:hypothetical protein